MTYVFYLQQETFELVTARKCGLWRTPTGRASGWVGSDVNDAVSRSGGPWKRRHAHHLKSLCLQTAQEKEMNGEPALNEGML